MEKQLKQLKPSKTSRSRLVEQHNRSKTSSGYPSFEVKGTVIFVAQRPRDTNITGGHIVGRFCGLDPPADGRTWEEVSEAWRSGELSDSQVDQLVAEVDRHEDEYIRAADWKEMPHVFLANLPTYDAQRKPTAKPYLKLLVDRESVAKFVKTYGVLSGQQVTHQNFDQHIADILAVQRALRRSWLYATGHQSMSPSWWAGYGGPDPFHVHIFQEGNHSKIELETRDLTTFIHHLFLRDCAAGKLGVCGNPDCPAPYFLKRRRNQKYCERGSCTAYAQRQYSLKSWRRRGKRSRAEKRRQSQGRAKR